MQENPFTIGAVLAHKNARLAAQQPKPRPIHEIAAEIKREWPKPYFGAVPYLQAMECLSDISETYIAESAKSIVTYFLANAQTFRGPAAKRIKAELKAMCGIK